MDLKPGAKRISINVNQQKNKMTKDLAGEEKEWDIGWVGSGVEMAGVPSETGNDKRVGKHR